jgi:hypothetical protein
MPHVKHLCTPCEAYRPRSSPIVSVARVPAYRHQLVRSFSTLAHGSGGPPPRDENDSGAARRPLIFMARCLLLRTTCSKFPHRHRTSWFHLVRIKLRWHTHVARRSPWADSRVPSSCGGTCHTPVVEYPQPIRCVAPGAVTARCSAIRGVYEKNSNV